MPNVLAPNGFQQFGRQEGGSPTAGLTAYKLDPTSAAIGYGDPVSMQATGLIHFAAAADVIQGIFYGCEYLAPAPLNRVVFSNSWPAPNAAAPGAEIIAHVCDDPAQLYVAQVNGGPATQADVGGNVAFTPSAAIDQFTGFSAASVALPSEAAVHAFRVVGLLSDFVSPSNTPNGIDNTSANNFVVVAPNNFARRVTAGI